MKRLVLFIAGIAFSVVGWSQPYGNEWIDYDQSYYKFPVTEKGVVRLDFNTLSNAGIPVSSLDPRNIQVFAREQEVPLYAPGESDGVFNVSDYIEFFVEPNDGWLDSQVYREPGDQLNPNYSLYNDTIYYYLTWNSSTSNARVETEGDEDIDDYSPRNWFWKNQRVDYTGAYYAGELNTYGGSTPYYTESEGWMSGRYGVPSGSPIRSTNVQTPLAFTGSGAPLIEFSSVSCGASNASGSPNHHTEVNIDGTTVANFTFTGYEKNLVTATRPPSIADDGVVEVQHEVIGDLGVASDYQALSYVDLWYPHQPDLGGASKATIHIPLNETGQYSRYDLSGLAANNAIMYVRGGETTRRLTAESQSGTHRFLVENMLGGDRFFAYITADSAVQSVESLTPVANNGLFTNFGLANVDSAFVVVTEESLESSAQAYANYRQQRFNSLVALTEELYDQFGGGIPKHGLAIRRFSDYLLDNWNDPPKFLMLIGKAVREAAEDAPGSRKNPVYYSRNLVPSFGYPSSDVAITAGLNGTELQPAIPTGRISALDNQTVLDYLQKVQTFEAQPHAEWMKRLIHFGGGQDLNEQDNFAFYLSVYEETIEDTCFGGTVTTFRKDSSEPIQINVSEEIDELITGGISYMTFFGHASGDGFDQSIDSPENFEWDGRYPFLIGNGCYTGDIFQPGSSSFSEEYTLPAEKGVIGFLANVKLGFEPFLHDYTRELYKQMGYKHYGDPIGDQIKYTIQEIQYSMGDPPNQFVVAQCLGMTLHGDPSLVINQFPKPDLAIEPSGIFFEPEDITAEVDSFTMNIEVKNIAKATNAEFEINIEHQLPDGSDSTYVLVKQGLYYKDTVSITLPVDQQYGLGLHSFDVYVDLPQNTVEELEGFESSNNSVIGRELLITTGGIVPVFPYEYSVIPQDEVVLKASTGEVFAEEKEYVFQVDTTDSFSSPALQENTIQSDGGVLEWQPMLQWPDSTVYFWRVAEATEPPSDRVWRESSFQYIPGEEGWGQAQFFQLKNNSFNQLEYNRPQRQIDFFTGSVGLRARVIGNSTSFANEVTLNTELVEYGGCFTNPSLHLMVFDPVTLEAWGTNYQGANPDNDFGNVNANGGCRPRVENYFIFRQNASQLQALADVLTDGTIPEDHYVLLYTWRFVNYDAWEQAPDIYDAVDELGATQVGTAQDSVPFIFLAQVGNPDFSQELYGSSISEELNLDVELPASGTNGVLVSREVGPAYSWDRLSWKFDELEGNDGDTTALRVTGIRANGTTSEIFDLESYDHQGEVENLGQFIDAQEFPKLRLRANMTDNLNATPAQVDRWHVLYNPVPEAALDPLSAYSFQDSVLQEGQEGSLVVAIRNVSQVDMDSLLVHYWIEGEDRQRHYIDYPRQDSLRAGEVLIDTLYFETLGFAGDNRLWVEVNPPVDSGSTTGVVYDQPEQYHFNNLAFLPFRVETDEENPLLDVTFDGVHIIDGEIVSAKPNVLITLKDENPFLIMDEPADTSNFKVFLTDPDDQQERIYFNPSAQISNMEFIPAGSDNRCKIIFKPELNVDGEYKLLVQAQDKSGNNSGINDYEVSFEVINRQTISEVLNYPNPFSTSTRFVFTLTGSEVPDRLRIQIMTVSGRVVREITEAEIGPLRIGRNITEYAWDGRDEFGDPLANGVYLYRVYARDNGQSVEIRKTQASQYFKKGIGKMYLMR